MEGEIGLKAYKERFVTVVLLLGYAFLHIQLTGVFVDTNLTEMLNFTTRLPFGQRLLMPSIAAVLAKVLPLNTGEIFFLIEIVFTVLFYLVLKPLLAHEFPGKEAKALSWLFILLLPLVTLVNYRFTSKGIAPFFYPYDTSSLFFMAAGMLLCLRKKWYLFIPLIFFATLNRESSILLILLIPALHWSERRQMLKPLLAASMVYVLARSLILYLLQGRPGQIVELYYRGGSHSLIEANLAWLFDQQELLFFVFCFAGLPLFWFAFYDYISLRYRPLRYVCFAYFMGLLFVGCVMESRIFLEIVLLLYMPVCLALKRWLQGLTPITPTCKGWISCLDRYSILTMLVILAACRGYLRF